MYNFCRYFHQTQNNAQLPKETNVKCFTLSCVYLAETDVILLVYASSHMYKG